MAHIEATYVIEGGGRSFTALLEGFRNAQTGERLLSGIITDHDFAKFLGSVMVTSYFSVSLSSGVMRSVTCS